MDHGRLLSKLPYYGIKDKELTLFENYLFGRRQSVINDGSCFASQPIVCGVPQGSILGPMLFILLINDIDQQLNSCKILLYADDTVVFTSSKKQETIEKNLNSDLSNLTNWFYENLVVNLKQGKTEFIPVWYKQEIVQSPWKWIYWCVIHRWMKWKPINTLGLKWINH